VETFGTVMRNVLAISSIDPDFADRAMKYGSEGMRFDTDSDYIHMLWNAY